MIIKQLSVFVENKKGRLAAIMDALAKNNIDISALSLADTSDFGVLRLILDKPDEAKKVLNEIGVIVKIARVIAIAMDDAPGGCAKAIRAISENNISIEYMYACIGKVPDKALMVMRVDDADAAEKIIGDCGLNDINPEDIYRI